MKTQLSKITLAAALAAALPAAAGAQTPLPTGGSAEGELTRESERVTSNDYYLDSYTVTGSAGDRIAIAMQSDDFDTLLEIGRMEDGEFMQMFVDDDGGDGLNSRLVFTFPETGSYVVRARTFGADATGNYTIEVSEMAPPPPPPPPIRIRAGQTMDGTLTMDSPTYSPDSYGGQDRHYALYELRGREGDTRTVTLRSGDFDAFLEIGGLTPVGFAVVESNDDGAAGEGEESLGLDSRLTVTFRDSGTLMIRATTLGGGATGAYSLSVE
ncbi:hypothetical protein HFP57_09930 [Parasphingopyxis algicola]|uniref:hypothetical protein n=1 Tax=Parasphingopyxis algicola TaxID=2026624 RepID=UPI0015A2A7BE|nr:hypothetical protein [Parasphingopyxis algicola]QLC25308.1 hypothetical protein HFP57_09930 [Parasphingopyxis algicola]